VFSAGATTSAVLLFRAGTIDANTAVLATASSIRVKSVLTWMAPNREFAGKVATYSTGLLAVAGLAATVLLV
jgi:uncharacterized membrane protein (DUF4010 family)